MKKIRVEEVRNKTLWEDFNKSFTYSAFFQSWDWGEVMTICGYEIFRLGCFYENRLVGVAQIIEYVAKRGHYLHVRQGPVIYDWGNKEVVIHLFQKVIEYGREKGASFIRMSPLLSQSVGPLREDLPYRIINSPVHNQDAENCWILKLDKRESEILSSMRKTTRYMIRKAEKLPITVEIGVSKSLVDVFLRLYAHTSETKHFVAHKRVDEEIGVFASEHKCFIYVAFQEGVALSAAVVVYYGNQAIYRHGATSEEGRRSPASYLIQWRAIQDAKKAGLSFYNFWGVSPSENVNHPWHGLTMFKKGFGGEQIDFQHSIDIPLKISYAVAFLIDYFTMIQKGYKKIL